MRLPQYLSRISPVGETLDAIGAGEEKLAGEITAENGRLSVASADRDGLSLWEADYGLEDATGMSQEVRRAKIRTAMSGAAPLTPAYLKELCVTIGGASFGEVEEDFPHWAVQVRPVTRDKVVTDTEILEESIRKLLPAHLSLEILPCALLTVPDKVFAVLSAGGMAQLEGTLKVDTAQGWAAMERFSVATGAVAPELWGRA